MNSFIPVHEKASLEEIRRFFLEDNKLGPGLHPDCVAECSEDMLRRMAELAGAYFKEWYRYNR